MVFLVCERCDAVHESTLPVCPGCGTCPCCGQRRVTGEQLREMSSCPRCQVPYCAGCGRCHSCGESRFADWEPCSCGFPSDPARVASVEQTFGLSAKEATKSQVLYVLGFLLL